MQTWDAITSRRNVRSFTDRPIPPTDLDRILEAGRRAPSSQNWQPWDFIVVTDREQLRALARVWRGAGHVAGSAATIVVIGPPADRPLAPIRHPDRRPFDDVVHRGRW
jgi:nitroreductase